MRSNSISIENQLQSLLLNQKDNVVIHIFYSTIQDRRQYPIKIIDLCEYAENYTHTIF